MCLFYIFFQQFLVDIINRLVRHKVFPAITFLSTLKKKFRYFFSGHNQIFISHSDSCYIICKIRYLISREFHMNTISTIQNNLADFRIYSWFNEVFYFLTHFPQRLFCHNLSHNSSIGFDSKIKFPVLMFVQNCTNRMHCFF